MTEGPVNADVKTAVAPELLRLLEQELDKIEARDAQFPLSISVHAPQLEPWQWLSANRALTSIAWSDRETEKTTATVGEAARVDVAPGQDLSTCVAQCRTILGVNQELKFFGGVSFDGSANWRSFGAGKFVLPRLQLLDGALTLAVINEEDIATARLDLKKTRFENEPVFKNFSEFESRTNLPNFGGWQSRIDEALSLIRSEVIEKIVLARQTVMKFGQPLNPIALAERLQASTNDCFVFSFGFGNQSAFVGATPERLFLRQGDRLESEVIAGTRMRGEDSTDDERLAIELLTSDKDQREHDIVRKSIRQRLHKFIDHLQVDSQASILRLARKQHLRSGVKGTLKTEVDDGMLLKRLHPTPAVGGYPTENALPEIARIEPFNRGWYAAPVGWIAAESAQFVVAIRSGLIEGNSLSLFSGAGIVRGSDPHQEWQEVENKIQDYISVLGAGS